MTFNGYVLYPQRRHSKGLMLLGIFGIPDSETSDVEKPYTERQHALSSKPTRAEIVRHSASQFG